MSAYARVHCVFVVFVSALFCILRCKATNYAAVNLLSSAAECHTLPGHLLGFCVT